VQLDANSKKSNPNSESILETFSFQETLIWSVYFRKNSLISLLRVRKRRSKKNSQSG